MTNWFSELLDKASDYLATRKGLLPFIGISLIIINYLMVLLLPEFVLSKTNFALHLGIILAIMGQLLAWAL